MKIFFHKVVGVLSDVDSSEKLLIGKLKFEFLVNGEASGVGGFVSQCEYNF